MSLSNPRREGLHGSVIQPIDSNRKVHMIISSNLLLLTLKVQCLCVKTVNVVNVVIIVTITIDDY